MAKGKDRIPTLEDFLKATEEHGGLSEAYKEQIARLQGEPAPKKEAADLNNLVKKLTDVNQEIAENAKKVVDHTASLNATESQTNPSPAAAASSAKKSKQEDKKRSKSVEEKLKKIEENTKTIADALSGEEETGGEERQDKLKDLDERIDQLEAEQKRSSIKGKIEGALSKENVENRIKMIGESVLSGVQGIFGRIFPRLTRVISPIIGSAWQGGKSLVNWQKERASRKSEIERLKAEREALSQEETTKGNGGTSVASSIKEKSDKSTSEFRKHIEKKVDNVNDSIKKLNSFLVQKEADDSDYREKKDLADRENIAEALEASGKKSAEAPEPLKKALDIKKPTGLIETVKNWGAGLIGETIKDIIFLKIFKKFGSGAAKEGGELVGKGAGWLTKMFGSKSNVLGKTTQEALGGTLFKRPEKWMDSAGKWRDAAGKFTKAPVEGIAKEGEKGAGWLSRFLGKGGGAVAKEGEKVAGKGMGKMLGKKIPVIGAALGAYFAFRRFNRGDAIGGVLELASGIASLFPGPGTAVSLAIDGLLLGRDLGVGKKLFGGSSEKKGKGFIGNFGKFFTETLFGKDSKAKKWALSGSVFGPIGMIVGGMLGMGADTLAKIFDFKNAEEMLKPVKLAIEDALWKFFQGVIDMFHLDKFGIKNPLGDNKPSEETAYQEMYGEGTFKAGAKQIQAGKDQRENYQKVKGAIGAAAQASGVSESTLTKFAMVESGFDAGIGAKTSSAKGLFQFTKGTWHYMINRPEYKKYGFTDAMITDPKANAIMGAAYINDNKKALAKGGWATDDTNLYLAHFLGAGGVTTFLNAWKKNPNAIAANILPKAAAANPNVFYDKKTKRPKTVQEVGQWAANKMNINLASLGPGAPSTSSATSAAAPQAKASGTSDTTKASATTPQSSVLNKYSMSAASATTPTGISAPRPNTVLSSINEQIRNREKIEGERKSILEQQQTKALQQAAKGTTNLVKVMNNNNATSTGHGVDAKHPATPDYTKLFEELGIDRIFA